MHVGSVDQRASWSRSKKSTRDGWFQASISLTVISDSTEVILSILNFLTFTIYNKLDNWFKPIFMKSNRRPRHMENDSKPLQNTFCGDVIYD